MVDGYTSQALIAQRNLEVIDSRERRLAVGDLAPPHGVGTRGIPSST